MTHGIAHSQVFSRATAFAPFDFMGMGYAMIATNTTDRP